MREVSTEEAKRLIDEADRAVLITATTEPVPTLGEVDAYEQEFEVETETVHITNDE